MDGLLIDPVLAKLGVDRGSVTPDAAGLELVYGAWCRGVPFDNLVKRIHLASGDATPIPNCDPDAFFASWLEHGTGGTCWPSTLALHALLVVLGFDVRIGSAAMRDDLAPDVHSHGTLLVTTFDGADRLWWVDSSMLTDAPVPLRAGSATQLDHPLRPVRVEPVDGGLWRVFWTSSSTGGELPCRLLDDDVTVEHCRARYEWSREFSPFNQSLYTTRNTADAVHTWAMGSLATLGRDGVHTTEVAATDRSAVLQATFGYSADILARVPPDSA
ncbi:MAG TPA: arylamine N-acetyltransferase [Acidimicrobiia bacterium]|jgi:N-hydroxyarylamine O-acetyltransferase